ncbi:MAG: DNA methylase [Clostridiaceae bacterium]
MDPQSNTQPINGPEDEARAQFKNPETEKKGSNQPTEYPKTEGRERIYIAIDLKSFYASVECIERGLDPMTTNLVVADPSRTEKTICLAVSPSLKSYGISGRARLFEAIQKIKEANAQRQSKSAHHLFIGESYDNALLSTSPELAVSYLIAPPRMALYMEYSTRIYHIYLKYIAPEHIHVYSIDEVFIDATDYLDTYRLTPHELTMMLIQEVLKATGITATAGIGTNLYLAKIAMDIQAKHITPDQDGVRIAELGEISYRELLWSHRPLTDFWRVGPGYAKKLEAHGIFTMGDVARCSLGKRNAYNNEDLLYKLFGINAELLIDHAWGWEPCTMADIKAYKPRTNSLSSGQILHSPYDKTKAKLIIREMTDLLVLDLVAKGLVTDQMVLTVGYDIENLTDPVINQSYQGEVTTDRYGRKTPKPAHGTINLKRQTSSTMLIMEGVMEVFDRIVDEKLLVRRLNITANHVVDEKSVVKQKDFEQLDLFTDYTAVQQINAEEEAALAREKRVQETVIQLKNKFGKNAVMKGTNLEEGATSIDRNQQIGGHKA